MFVKEIEFTDYNGQSRKETYRFHLNKAEVVMWMTTSGDYTLDKIILRIAQERNGRKIMEMFEDLIHRSYGKVSVDSIRFEKSEEIWLEFFQSEAYAIFFTDLISDATHALEFVKGIIPKDMADEIGEAIKSNKDGLPAELKDYIKDVPNA